LVLWLQEAMPAWAASGCLSTAANTQECWCQW
jgi:hypothetical protein